MVSLFERLSANRPPAVGTTIQQPRRNPSPIERLLDWLVNHWAKPTVTAREIYTFGPRSLRDKRTALSLAQTLVERGWLTPVDGHDRRDMHEWSIARKPTPWFDDPACRTPIRPSAP